MEVTGWTETEEFLRPVFFYFFLQNPKRPWNGSVRELKVAIFSIS